VNRNAEVSCGSAPAYAFFSFLPSCLWTEMSETSKILRVGFQAVFVAWKVSQDLGRSMCMYTHATPAPPVITINLNALAQHPLDQRAPSRSTSSSLWYYCTSTPPTSSSIGRPSFALDGQGLSDQMCSAPSVTMAQAYAAATCAGHPCSSTTRKRRTCCRH
jgi:hypothetical protein